MLTKVLAIMLLPKRPCRWWPVPLFQRLGRHDTLLCCPQSARCFCQLHAVIDLHEGADDCLGIRRLGPPICKA